jgi:hypothetical protein
VELYLKEQTVIIHNIIHSFFIRVEFRDEYGYAVSFDVFECNIWLPIRKALKPIEKRLPVFDDSDTAVNGGDRRRGLVMGAQRN